jgi:hypothetical protein
MTPAESEAVQILRRAAAVTLNFKSYHFVYVSGNTKNQGDVQAPDKCRSTHGSGPFKIETTRVGRFVYSREIVADTYVGFERQCPDDVSCACDFLPRFRDDVSRLTYTSIPGREELDGHRVVQIRYEYQWDDLESIPPGSYMAPQPVELWIEEQTARIIKVMPDIYEPEFYYLYSRFDEPVVPPIETPSSFVTPTPTIMPTSTVMRPTPTFGLPPVRTVVPDFPTFVLPLRVPTAPPYFP